MKKIIFLGLISIFLSSQNNSLNAQKYFGQYYAYGSFGFGLKSPTHKKFNQALRVIGESDLRSKLHYMGGLDVGLSDRISMGFIMKAHVYNISYTKYLYTDHLGVTTTEDYSGYDQIFQMGAGIRLFYHLGDNDDFDLSFGTCISYDHYAHSPMGSGRNEVFDKGQYGSKVKIQGLAKCNFFFTETIGIQAELGVGGTYFASIGIVNRRI